MMVSPATLRSAVLIVDDEAAARATLIGLLADDYEVDSVADAAAAEAALARRCFDVVVTDYEMPGTSGIELLRRISDRHPNVVGIIVTGHAMMPEIQAARRSRRDFTVLLKPYDPRLLLRAVQSAASMAQLRRATCRLGERTPKSG
jgi:DNA-binding NtrC family response regulator